MATGMLFVGCIWVIWLIKDRMKSWLIVRDEDGGFADVRRVVPREGEVIIKKKGHDPKVYFLNQKGRLNSNRGGFYEVDAKNGATLIGPNRVEWEAMIKAKSESQEENARLWGKLRILDPLFAFHVLKHKVAQDFLRAKEEKEHWAVKLAPLMLIALIMLVGVVGFLGYQLSQAKGA